MQNKRIRNYIENGTIVRWDRDHQYPCHNTADGVNAAPDLDNYKYKITRTDRVRADVYYANRSDNCGRANRLIKIVYISEID